MSLSQLISKKLVYIFSHYYPSFLKIMDTALLICYNYYIIVGTCRN